MTDACIISKLQFPTLAKIPGLINKHFDEFRGGVDKYAATSKIFVLIQGKNPNSLKFYNSNTVLTCIQLFASLKVHCSADIHLFQGLGTDALLLIEIRACQRYCLVAGLVETLLGLMHGQRSLLLPMPLPSPPTQPTQKSFALRVRGRYKGVEGLECQWGEGIARGTKGSRDTYLMQRRNLTFVYCLLFYWCSCIQTGALRILFVRDQNFESQLNQNLNSNWLTSVSKAGKCSMQICDHILKKTFLPLRPLCIFIRDSILSVVVKVENSPD